MTMPILSTKLYIPPPRPNAISRSRLTERLNEGLHRKLTLVSASAGFGKTTLASEWIAGCGRSAAWLSLDEGDNDPARFLTYLTAALQTIGTNVGESVFGMLQSSHSPPIESILTALLNEIHANPNPFVLVLDDYHVIDANPIDQALVFLLERMPPQMHVVVATREDPQFPLARLRVRGQLTELRAVDLRFTLTEAAGFLNQAMGLHLSPEDVAALETRTEGWIAGLQLAAISMQGHKDAAGFIKSFTGSHRFVLDYLVEEVLQQQSDSVQAFLLRTSVLDRMCGPLCDAVQRPDDSTSGQETLEALERANLFIVPLDNERRWYRYHHLFAELLRQRLSQSAASSAGGKGSGAAELHICASIWYEDNGLEIEAFQHAAAANDIERAARLVEGKGMPLLFRGAVGPVLNWLESLPATVLTAMPSLLAMHASALLLIGQLPAVEQKLQAAEAALQGVELDEKTRDLVGHIASIRAAIAVSQHQVETIIAQSRRALEHLHPDNLPVRTATTWTLGYACQLQGDRTAANRAYTEAISISQTIGHLIILVSATIGLGSLHQSENRLGLAEQTYRRALELAGDPPMPIACEAHLGLAKLAYERNELDAAEWHGQKSVQLARLIENTDRFVACDVFFARLKLARGDAAGAAALLAKAGQLARQHRFMHLMPEIAAIQALALLRQGNPTAAERLAREYDLPVSLARVRLAVGDTSAALAALEPLRRHAEARGWEDERLKVMILQAVALYEHGDKGGAVRLLGDALALAEPGGFIRLFVDEGVPMARLLIEASARGIRTDYAAKLLAVFEAASLSRPLPLAQPLIEPLSERELEVLRLISEGLSNHEICERLFLALSTVKGHNRTIFDKLQVHRRTEAVARARELGLL
ncbi:LuxR C-terminal-related transcriptional regulator [Cohnella faecalis]|uniref:LuxR family transcriptional regulator n=1 Tax=Cohnella faecalis TaxID=2315694 RepID=A0A398CVE8_9BACL|nr:LuxR C-terminal-related transcriptional regulator [Cohnella faecalis]RIE02974.1 LuxR family transcriptional regulator [Cohnella faecalis]